MSTNGTCTHIKVTGVRCGSPALKGEQFCYFHQNAHRTVRRPKQSRLHPIALIEDEESIQYALMEVINALMKNTIDLKRATLILRALHIAVKNASRVKYSLHAKNMVTDIPKYAEPPIKEDFDETSQIDLPYNAWVPPKSERQIMEEKARAQKLREWRDSQAAIRENLERARITPREPAQPTEAKRTETAPENVGAAALGCPGREATVPAPAPATTASVTASPVATSVPPHNFKRTQPSAQQATQNHETPSARKPPQPATSRAPKERKSTAHAARHG